MAKLEIKHLALFDRVGFIKVSKECNSMDDYIHISGECGSGKFYISLDKSTAIKFAKTLRTEINKIPNKDGE